MLREVEVEIAPTPAPERSESLSVSGPSGAATDASPADRRRRERGLPVSAIDAVQGVPEPGVPGAAEPKPAPTSEYDTLPEDGRDVLAPGAGGKPVWAVPG